MGYVYGSNVRVDACSQVGIWIEFLIFCLIL